VNFKLVNTPADSIGSESLMRIFQAIESGANPSVRSNRTWLRNLYEPLVEMGHEVVLFHLEEGRRVMRSGDVAERGRFSEKLVENFFREHQRKPFDLIFTYLMDGMVDPTAIDQIRKSGTPACNFSCNNAHQFYLVDELSPHFDFNLHAEKDVRDKFLAIGANPVWWPMASNPKYFKPLDLPRTIQTSFVGGCYALRARYIAHLLENGIDAHAYGPGWQREAGRRWRGTALHTLLVFRAALAATPEARARASGLLAENDFQNFIAARFPANLHPPVSDEELVALYSRSQVSLGFLEVYDQHDPSRPIVQHIHLREFEAPMCAALYFTGYTDELAEMFEPDKEVVVYRNQHELLDKARYYLAHPDIGEGIRQAGLMRALSEHTYKRRFETLFRQIGLEKV
jgi:spore maturation protein CgeB